MRYMTEQNESEKKIFWRRHEQQPAGAEISAAEALAMLRFNDDGLLPVITQCGDSGRVLMLAWMNREALNRTLTEGHMVYFSRQRQCLWRKGETSGCQQKLLALSADCDGDTLLATVAQTGAACHTSRRTCFYWLLSHDGGHFKIVSDDKNGYGD